MWGASLGYLLCFSPLVSKQHQGGDPLLIVGAQAADAAGQRVSADGHVFPEGVRPS